MWASLGLLYDQGVAVPDGMSLTLDQRGMPILVGGLTMTEERLRQTPRTIIHGRGGEDQLQILVTKAVFPPVAKEDSKNNPTPLAIVRSLVYISHGATSINPSVSGRQY